MLEKNRPVYLQRGFSLIELAVVLVIVGILVGGLIGTLGSRIDTSRQVETKQSLEDIRTALYGFAMSQTPVRLPCPDNDNDGLEDLTAGQCDVLTTLGNLPWVTLGLQRGDVWGSTYSYWVADAFSNAVGFNLATGSAGVAQIDDAVAGNTIANNVVAVIFSHGKNQYGSVGIDNVARTAVPAGAAYNDERENQDVDAAAPVLFINRAITDENAPVIFDDMLLWISEYEIKGKMVQAGVLPP
jgi:prepilin-type N-terminal cleavage/methylation domain-containing protein